METENKTVLTPGTIALAATPIGNPLDASFRLVAALREADLIAAEDTRRVKRLATELGVRLTARTLAYHEHNERERTEALLDAAREGQKVLLVTDAGMPAVSDPGFRAVDAAHRAGIAVKVFPGPSAPLTALVQSGIAPDRFAFEGFLPRTAGKRFTALEALAHEQRTLLFFESPRRTRDTLEVMAEVFGEDRDACVARELTKTHEEIVRGPLSSLVEWARANEVLGEIVIVVAPAPPSEEDPADLAALVLERAESGERLKDAAKAVARAHQGVSARDLYDAALERKND
ncbi:16S rRNA (cytidine(1402)-2'-O)-methyltransferase [Dermabacter sp. Marseille-Q3180]|uniref:16S rRNA (cytidine(1402)-2'-O)-methyltransferase n=1 Tax=Dermabacter sp. Marseille-Q3180 TaxID=2758090 RepID=UPI002024B268|nr:16S rRNA (cytidine(1402)-2'-O)-methyltransferase [Dermabacter sp. Marseille-Q3180]